MTNVQPKDRDIAMVFQNCALYPHMSVADNMGLALKTQLGSVVTLAARPGRVHMFHAQTGARLSWPVGLHPGEEPSAAALS